MATTTFSLFSAGSWEEGLSGGGLFLWLLLEVVEKYIARLKIPV